MDKCDWLWIVLTLKECMKKMTDTSNSQWGAFTPVMPAFVRLIASVVVLLIVNVVVLGFPGINTNITGTAVSIASLTVFCIGLVVAFIVLKFGTQLATAAANAYKAYRTWIPLLAFFFQIVAIGILYAVTNPLAAPYFTSTPWAIPLIFLLLALLPTLRMLTTFVKAFEGPSHSTRHNPTD